MKYLTALSISILYSINLLAASTQCEGIYYNNEAPTIINSKLSPKTKELCYSAFAVMHSGISHTPIWSAEHLTRQSLRKKIKRSNDFHEEELLDSDERAELRDYSHSGYDRGHMAPSADMPTKLAQHECFTLANMIPQNSDNNRGIWAAIESSTRGLAKDTGELYVITGPLFIGTAVGRIKGRVLIPTKLYKAIYNPSTHKGAAYLVDNSSGEDYEVISIMELEHMAGIQFFPQMDASSKQTAMQLPDPEVKYGHTYRNKSDMDILRLLKKILNGKW